jgi:spore germination cell wall hydrolase CwlJ-like protein
MVHDPVIPLSAADLAQLTVSDPTTLEAVSPQEAVEINAAIPLSNTANPPASPLIVPLGSGVDYLRALDCMTSAIYYEAASESEDGQRAVAQVVLNRTRDPVYPSTICGVVFQGSERVTGCQFSFTCDGSLARTPVPALWSRARAIASRALAGSVFPTVGWATHYHANYVVPKWAHTLAKTTQVGLHIFYRWPGARGTARAFTQRYGGTEALPQIIEATLNDPDPQATGEPGAAVSLSERPVLADDASTKPATAPKAPGATGVPTPPRVSDTNRWVIKDPAAAADAAGQAPAP